MVNQDTAGTDIRRAEHETRSLENKKNNKISTRKSRAENKITEL
jgi:hypothetical protein